MTEKDIDHFLSPEYVQHNDMMRMLARLLATADAEIGTNELEASLFLMFVDFESIIRSFGETRKTLPTVIDYRAGGNVRQQIADRFRAHVKQSNGVTEHFSAYIDYLADCLDH